MPEVFEYNFRLYSLYGLSIKADDTAPPIASKRLGTPQELAENWIREISNSYKRYALIKR